MTTQTKCTIALCSLFIIEIFPLPFTAMISLYVVRRRPKWFPNVVEGLYNGVAAEPDFTVEDGGVATRRKCTIVLTTMFIIDLVVPVTIPFGLYVIRRRPKWFKSVAGRLYAPEPVDQEDFTESETILEDSPEIVEAQRKKHLELEKINLLK